MPRKRYISPSIWENEDFLALSPAARLVWIGIWSICDRNGCFEWRPVKLAYKFAAGIVLASDGPAILEELAKAKFAKRYEANGEAYGFCIKWHKHQDCHVDEPPVYPMPEDPDFTPNPPIGAKGLYWTKKNAKWMREVYGFGVPEEDASALDSQKAPVSAPVSAPLAAPSSPSQPSRPSGEINTPLPPEGEAGGGGGHQGKPKRSRKGKAEAPISLLIPEPIVALTNAVLDATPAKQPDDAPIRKDPGKLASRLIAILDAKIPGVTPDVLLLAWKLYLQSGPKAIKAPQYFFGEAEHQGANGAHWLEWARLAYRKLNPQPSGTATNEAAATAAAPLPLLKEA